MTNIPNFKGQVSSEYNCNNNLCIDYILSYLHRANVNFPLLLMVELNIAPLNS